jgi:phosphatidylserine/phosphatidylglycerophosphate/cardiolipin synthase-like enzyme
MKTGLRNPALLLCIGFILGIVVAEAFYIYTTPLILPDGAIAVVNDRDYFPKVSELLGGAQKSIHIIMFSANYQTQEEYMDSATNLLLQSLISARNKGIEVKMFMDDWPEGNSKTLNYLEKNNVPVSTISIDGTVHSKLIIIDSKIVVVGSTNWSYHALDKNRETNVIINDERVARLFEDYFSTISSN